VRAIVLVLAMAIMTVMVGVSVADTTTYVPPGPVVICGNELSSAYVFTVHDGKVYYGPYQAWPPIKREDKLAKERVAGRASDSLTVRWQQVKREVRREVADGVRRNIIEASGLQLAYSYVNRYNLYRDVVDSAWVNPVSGNPWVLYKTPYGADSTEIMLGDWSPPTESDAESWAKLWNDLRANGCSVYLVWHGKNLYVAPENVEQARTRFEQMKQGVAVEDSIPASFRTKNRQLVEQLKHPVPLDSLRTER
jgi:hypothetical protein